MNVFVDYLKLCKCRVIALMLLTAWIGMLLASGPHHFPWRAFVLGTLGIASCAGAAAVMNHLVERHIDIRMQRTQLRPVASGRITPRKALQFSLFLGILGTGILFFGINSLTALLTVLSLLGYALLYTLFLKQATPQNIVIGGLAGAAPPLLGWTAVTNSIDPFGLLLVLIIFTWTPPHFWALAIYRKDDYAKAKLPMLPITHGVRFTKLCIVLYTVLLVIATILPYLTHSCGITYLVCALGLGAGFLYYAVALYFSRQALMALRTFHFSIVYLMALFLGLLTDHYLHHWIPL